MVLMLSSLTAQRKWNKFAPVGGSDHIHDLFDLTDSKMVSTVKYTSYMMCDPVYFGHITLVKMFIRLGI